MVKEIPVPRVRISPLHELQRFLQKDRKEPIRVKQLMRMKRVKRSYTDSHRHYIVCLRYGSLTDFSHPQLSWAAISRITGVVQSTCRGMVLDFHIRGNSAKRRFSPGRTPNPLPDDVAQYIRHSLIENRFLSLRERCSEIFKKFAFHMRPERLRKTYRRMDIRFSRTKTVYKKATKELVSRQRERVEFAKKLTSLLVQNKPVIFADESSWGSWDKPTIKRTWQHSQEPIRHCLNTTRMGNVTMYGCVGNCLDQLYFELHKGTTSEGWKSFLIGMKGQLQARYQRDPVTLVVDNH